MILTLIYIISVVYCVYKMYKSYTTKNEDPTHASPGLETLAILVMAPVLMAVDVSMTWVRLYRERKQ
jgi:hypothetical protein